LRIYSGSSRGEHYQFQTGQAPDFSKDKVANGGAILLHSLRRDGFCYLESDGGDGVLLTKPVLFRHSELKLNVLAPLGEVRVEISDIQGKELTGYSYAECVPFSGDSLAWTPTWRNASLEQLAGRMVRIGIRLVNARLYAIRGNLGYMNDRSRLKYEQGLPL